MYGHVITKFSRIGRLLHFLTHSTPLVRFARESSAINVFFFFLSYCYLQSYRLQVLYLYYCAFQKHVNSDVQSPTDAFAFFAEINILSGPLRKQNFSLTGSKGHGKVIP